MPDSNDTDAESVADSGASYDSPDWIGLDTGAMRARRYRQLRQLHFHRNLELMPVAIDAVLEPVVRSPRPLVHGVHIENLKSLSGMHDVTLAPLTLVYGPNAAGKSTILHALRLMRSLLNVGHRDALGVWSSLEDDQLHDVMTEQASFTDPVESEEFESGARTTLQNWKRLSLGVDFATRDGRQGQARLECRAAGRLPIPWHASSIIGPSDAEPARKEFHRVGRAAWRPWQFGEDAHTVFTVRENGSEATRVFDARLFAHTSVELQEDLFALAYFMLYLGPHRGAPTSEYEPMRASFRNRLPKGMRHEPLLDDITDWNLGDFGPFEYLNQMLSQLDIPYEFIPSASSNEIIPPEDPAYLKNWARTWHLMDVRSGARVGLNQVGYGISQLLPVIEACVHARRQLICVEEPELHLHPRLQARLANLVATSVATFGNQVVLETHSESILLRVRRLVRAGKLRPEDVSLLYVDNTEVGASVQRLRLGERGELLDPWPTGFFDDSLSDVLQVIE